MQKPYRLFKRKPQNIWYYRTEAQTTARSTGCTRRADAEHYVLRILSGEDESDKAAKETVGSFTKGMFVEGKCKLLARKKQKGKTYGVTYIQMRRGHLKNHILPKYHNRAIATITHAEIDQWLTGLKVANKTKNHILDTLRVIWDEAIFHGILTRDATLRIEKFANNSKITSVFDNAELGKLFQLEREKLIELWGSLQNAALFTVLATTGIRLGEAQALKWGDLIESQDSPGALSIHKALKNDRSIGETKNKTSRVAFILDNGLELMKDLRAESPYASDDDFMFPNGKGEPLDRKQCLRIFRQVLDRADITYEDRNLKIHSFRHTFNTMHRNTVGDNVLRKLTGHLSENMTDHYDHPDVKNSIEFLKPHHEALDRRWRESIKGTIVA